MTLPVEVIEAVRQRRALLVLGSRATQEAVAAAGRSWTGAAELARKLGWEPPRRIMGATRSRAVTPSVEQGAERFEATHGRGALVRELRRLVGAEGVAPTDVHRVALRRFPVILTTTWDDLLERAAPETGPAPRVVLRGTPLPDDAGDAPVLVRLRNGFHVVEGPVVTRPDFAARPHPPALRRQVRDLVRSHEVLFVGFRPDEEEFDRLWEDLTDAYGGELPRCHMAVAQGRMDDFLWQKWVWRGLLMFTADPVECMAEIEERLERGA